MSFKQPISDARHGLTLVKHSLECQPPPGALESLSLTLSGLTGDAGRQESLFRDVRRRENLQEALSQMEARFGRRPPIFQVREVEPWSRLPERRQALVPFVP
jgi:DNA polymerase-4/protein ImuB